MSVTSEPDNESTHSTKFLNTKYYVEDVIENCVSEHVFTFESHAHSDMYDEVITVMSHLMIGITLFFTTFHVEALCEVSVEDHFSNVHVLFSSIFHSSSSMLWVLQSYLIMHLYEYATFRDKRWNVWTAAYMDVQISTLAVFFIRPATCMMDSMFNCSLATFAWTLACSLTGLYADIHGTPLQNINSSSSFSTLFMSTILLADISFRTVSALEKRHAASSFYLSILCLCGRLLVDALMANFNKRTTSNPSPISFLFDFLLGVFVFFSRSNWYQVADRVDFLLFYRLTCLLIFCRCLVDMGIPEQDPAQPSPVLRSHEFFTFRPASSLFLPMIPLGSFAAFSLLCSLIQKFGRHLNRDLGEFAEQVSREVNAHDVSPQRLINIYTVCAFTTPTSLLIGLLINLSIPQYYPSLMYLMAFATIPFTVIVASRYYNKSKPQIMHSSMSCVVRTTQRIYLAVPSSSWSARPVKHTHEALTDTDDPEAEP